MILYVPIGVIVATGVIDIGEVACGVVALLVCEDGAVTG